MYYRPADLIVEKNITHGELWLGSLKSATDHVFKIYSSRENFLKNMKAVLTTASNLPINYTDIAHLTLNIDDDDNYPISDYFQQSYEFIDHYIQLGNVLDKVHCHAGISRSATIVIAYLMKQYAWSFSKAVHFVELKRPMINPNDGFMEQLVAYESKCVVKQQFKLNFTQLLVQQGITARSPKQKIKSPITGRVLQVPKKNIDIQKKQSISEIMIRPDMKQFRIKNTKIKTQT